MTSAEFLAWEATQGLRWEFDGFQRVAITGGTDAHAAVQGNVVTALTTRLRGKPCYARGPDMKVGIGSRYSYLDASVSCTPVSRSSTVAADPIVIFEVLSESTAKTDRMAKLTEYRSLPSVQRYVMLEQDETRAGTGCSLETLDANLL